MTYKLLGSDNAIEEKAGTILEGIGFPLRPVESGTPNVVVLQGFSDANQEPSSTDSPITVNFGSAQGGPNDPVQLGANGEITINERGYYRLNLTFKVGRIGSSGGVAYIFLRGLRNNTQVGRALNTIVDSPNIAIPEQFEISGFFEVGEVIKAQIYRDSSGVNEGGLLVETSSIGWGIAPSARIEVNKF